MDYQIHLIIFQNALNYSSNITDPKKKTFNHYYILTIIKDFKFILFFIL